MLSTLGNLLLLLGFAWLARALLDARSVTWGRLLGAALLGVTLGTVVAVLLLVPSVEALQAADFERIRLVAFPFQLIATMGAMVVLELLFEGGRRGPRSNARRLGAGRRIRLALGIAGRAWTVSRIAARHGLAPLLGLGRGGTAAREPAELARRARSALEEAGGVFVKLGQLMATRPDLLPPEALEELGRLHASVGPLPAAEVRAGRDCGRWSTATWRSPAGWRAGPSGARPGAASWVSPTFATSSRSGFAASSTFGSRPAACARSPRRSRASRACTCRG